jgi:thymidylate synthase (FAD)
MSSEAYYKGFDSGKKNEVMELEQQHFVLGDGIGFVKYITHCGSDEVNVEAARQSTQKGFLGWGDYQKWVCELCKYEWIIAHESGFPVSEPYMCNQCNKGEMKKVLVRGDEKLLNTLMRENHTTPFEMAELIVQVKAPIMVFREWHRHRTFSYNEMSGRYIQMPNEHYIPALRLQDQKNRQGSTKAILEGENAEGWMSEQQQEVYHCNEQLLEAGVAKEVARINTPISRYSVMYAKANLHNWFHFLDLRMRPNAQWEIRQYANACAEIIKFLWPRSFDLFVEHKLNAVRFSASEMKLMQRLLQEFESETLDHHMINLVKKISGYKEIY